MVIMFSERFWSTSTYIASTLLDSQLYTLIKMKILSIYSFVDRKLCILVNAFSLELEVGFTRWWNFTIFCFPETKLDLSEIFLQSRANTPWCDSPGRSPARCKKIFCLSLGTLNTCVSWTALEYLLCLGRSCSVRFCSCRNCCELFVLTVTISLMVNSSISKFTVWQQNYFEWKLLLYLDTMEEGRSQSNRRACALCEILG